MRYFSPAILAATALFIGGCSSPPEPASTTAPASAGQTASRQTDEMLTGSRIPNRKTTERLVKSVGAQEARDALNGQPKPLKSE